MPPLVSLMTLSERMVVVMLGKPEVGTCPCCNKSDQELRPYGENGSMICHECAMKDEQGTAKRFDAIIQQAVAAAEQAEQGQEQPSIEDVPHPLFKQAIEHPTDVSTKMMQDSIFRLTHPLFEVPSKKSDPPVNG